MRLVYLCTADPPPPNSDWLKVQDFFKTIPDYLHPKTREMSTPHMLYFADRIGNNWLPEFHDFAVVFLPETFLTNKKALSCLSRAKTVFPNMVGIDLNNNLSSEMIKKANQFCKRIFSLSEGKEFLLTTFPEIAAAYDLETKELTESIETEGYKYLDDTINDLNQRERKNRWISLFCYGLSFIVISILLAFVSRRFYLFTCTGIDFNIQMTIVLCVEIIALSALGVSICRFLFLLGKSFMVEAIRCADRAHAIGLGRLYLKLFKGKFKWEELRDVLQSWNIDNGSAFINLDAKDIEGVSLDKITSVITK